MCPPFIITLFFFLAVTNGGPVPTTLSPNYGNQLGGTLVTVRGPCFSELSNIQCEFDGRTMVALYKSELLVYCTTPSLSRSGRVSFRLLVDGEVRGETFYTACESMGCLWVILEGNTTRGYGGSYEYPKSKSPLPLAPTTPSLALKVSERLFVSL